MPPALRPSFNKRDICHEKEWIACVQLDALTPTLRISSAIQAEMAFHLGLDVSKRSERRMDYKNIKARIYENFFVTSQLETLAILTTPPEQRDVHVSNYIVDNPEVTSVATKSKIQMRQEQLEDAIRTPGGSGTMLDKTSGQKHDFGVVRLGPEIATLRLDAKVDEDDFDMKCHYSAMINNSLPSSARSRPYSKACF